MLEVSKRLSGDEQAALGIKRQTTMSFDREDKQGSSKLPDVIIQMFRHHIQNSDEPDFIGY